MVRSCSAFGCTNRFSKDGIGFYVFPKKPVRRKLWVLALKRKNFEPTQSSAVCGEHFQTGKPSRDPNHPDYVPNIFVFKPSKKTHSKSKMERQERKIKNLPNDNSAAEKNVSLETFSADNTSQIEELSESEEDMVNLETALLQECTEISAVEEEREASDVVITHLKRHDELLNLKLELHQAYCDISTLKADKAVLIKDLTGSGLTQSTLYSSSYVKEAELSKQRKELQQAYEEINALRKEKEELQKKLAAKDLTHNILQNPSKLQFYTGLNSVKDFHLILTLLSNVESNILRISREKQVLIILMKLKLNLLYSDLAYIFQTSKSTVCRIFESIIPHLEIKLHRLVKSPVNNALKKNIPASFKNTVYENLYQRLHRHSKSKTKLFDDEETD